MMSTTITTNLTVVSQETAAALVVPGRGRPLPAHLQGVWGALGAGGLVSRYGNNHRNNVKRKVCVPVYQ